MEIASLDEVTVFSENTANRLTNWVGGLDAKQEAPKGQVDDRIARRADGSGPIGRDGLGEPEGDRGIAGIAIGADRGNLHAITDRLPKSYLRCQFIGVLKNCRGRPRRPHDFAVCFTASHCRRWMTKGLWIG